MKNWYRPRAETDRHTLAMGEYIHEMHNAGVSYYELADEIGVSRPTIRNWEKKFLGIIVPKSLPPDIERFNAQCVPNGDCIEWQGRMHRHGYYGIFKINRSYKLAHRWSYEYHIGPIPDGLVIDHVCENMRCVYHGHLVAVTNGENRRLQRDGH